MRSAFGLLVNRRSCAIIMAEKAEWVGADTEISVNVRSALEWRPEEWE